MILDIRPTDSNRAVYLAAIGIADQQQRQAFLEQACAGDAERRGEIQLLLAAHHNGGFANPVDQAIEQLGPAETRGPEVGLHRPISASPAIRRSTTTNGKHQLR